jgi:hypothetical protein
MDAARAREQFAAVSAALTGFDEAELHGTGLVATYLDLLTEVLGAPFTDRFLAAAHAVVTRAGDALASELRLRLLDDATYGPVARNVAVLWYLGQWDQLPAAWRDRQGASTLDETGVVSPEAYRGGLVWLAAGVHPQGAHQQGFGAWALPPAVTVRRG